MTGHVVLHSLDTRDSHAKSMLVQLACLVSTRRQRHKIAGTERMLMLGPFFFRDGPRLIGRTFGVGSAYYRRAVHRQSITPPGRLPMPYFGMAASYNCVSAGGSRVWSGYKREGCRMYDRLWNAAAWVGYRRLSS